MTKKIISCILCFFIALLPSYAVMAEEMGKVNVEVKYDDDISPSQGDNFVIEYSLNSDQFKSAEITIDSSEFTDSDGNIELPCENYAILGITYEGENEDILEQGYGTVRTFYCSNSVDGRITIAIGDKATAKLENDLGSEGVWIMDNNHTEDGAPLYIKEKVEALANTEENTESSDTTESTTVLENVDETETEKENETVITDNGEAKVEHYLDTEEGYEQEVTNNVKKNNSKEPIVKLGILLFVAISGLGTIFYLHSKGKF